MNIHYLCFCFCEESKHLNGYSPFTIKRYQDSIKFFAKQTQVYNITEINDKKVWDFMMHGRTCRNWSESTFISYHKSLVVFFRWCVKNGYMEYNYAQDIATPRVRKSLPRNLTKQQAERILEVVYNLPYHSKYQRYRNHAIFSTFLMAGLRTSELVNLRYSDVDMEKGTIFVRSGKGNKDRLIPMSPKLVFILDEYLKARRKNKNNCPEFFASIKDDKGFTNAGLRRIVQRVRQVSGIHFSVHMLRHTFATLMIEGGCDIYSLSKLMGHSDIKTTTIYLAVSSQFLREQSLKHPMNEMKKAG